MTPGPDADAPPDLPPLRAAERLRLALRTVWAIVTLALLFVLFLAFRLLDLGVSALTGRTPTRLSALVVRFWAMLALPTLGLRYVQHGQPMGSGGAIAANHSSWIDIVALQRAAAPFLVSKAEVRDWPVIGLIGRAIGTMFIDRRAGTVRDQGTELLTRLSRGDLMALFPEGTSTDGLSILPFKSSLFAVFLAPELRGQVAVQPVTIVYRTPPHQPSRLYGWWGDMDFADHITNVLARSAGGVVELTFHPPLRVGDFPSRKALAQAAEHAVRKGFAAARAGMRTHEPDASGRPSPE